MVKENKTQIEVSIDTRQRLQDLRLVERESYDGVINRILDKK